ncbi:MAG: hypothetical protein ABRQ27_17170 [Clostridiaceae bacterium]
MNEKKCSSCGSTIDLFSFECVYCGADVNAKPAESKKQNNQDFWLHIALAACCEARGGYSCYKLIKNNKHFYDTL